MRAKKLCKSKDKKICGVCGGIAEYLEMDPTIVRVIYAILFMTTGIGLLPYIIAAIIMNDSPESTEDAGHYTSEYTGRDDIVDEASEPAGFTPGYDDDDEIKGFKI